jgi:hypothetical protein
MATSDQLTSSDIAFLIESLRYTRLAYESTSYPTYELRQEQLAKVDKIVAKLRGLLAS